MKNPITSVPVTAVAGSLRIPLPTPKSDLLLLMLLLAIAALTPARAENVEHILWGVMDWKNDSSFPDTDTSPTRTIYRDGGGRIICHQYQSSNWLAFKVSTTNKAEVSRIYANGDCINLMLYFVNCTHNTGNNTFGYPLNDQFLADYAQLLNAYKVGGGPLYVQAFPEFEEWYRNKPAAEQDQYRQKIREQFAAMVQITRTNYSRAYLGLCFEGQDFVGDTSQFGARWDAVLATSDLVYLNSMSAWPQWNDQAIEMVKGTKLLAANWGLPIMFPFAEIWVDANTPIFTVGHNYATDAANFSSAITNWMGTIWTAPNELVGSGLTDWATNLRTLKSRNLFAFSLYSAHYCNKPVTPSDPAGFTHPLQSYTVLTNLMRANARAHLYPVAEVEYWQNATNAPAASTSYTIETDANCSSSKLVVLNSTSAMSQYLTFKVPVTRAGTYQVLVGTRRQSNGGWFNLYVDGSGSPQGSERNCSLATGAANYQEYDQGLVTFSGITRTKWTSFKFGVSRAGNGGGYKLPIDYIKLIPQATVAKYDLVKDNTDGSGVTLTGNWPISVSTPGYYGANYAHDDNTGKGTKSVRYTPTVPATGSAKVYARWTSHANRANNVPIDITHASGTSTVTVNQQQAGGQWYLLGTYSFNAGTGGNVLIRTTGTSGYVVADAVRFVQQ